MLHGPGPEQLALDDLPPTATSAWKIAVERKRSNGNWMMKDKSGWGAMSLIALKNARSPWPMSGHHG